MCRYPAGSFQRRTASPINIHTCRCLLVLRLKAENKDFQITESAVSLRRIQGYQRGAKRGHSHIYTVIMEPQKIDENKRFSGNFDWGQSFQVSAAFSAFFEFLAERQHFFSELWKIEMILVAGQTTVTFCLDFVNRNSHFTNFDAGGNIFY